MGSTVQICCLIKILRDSQIKLTKQEYVKCTASKPCRNNQWNKAVCYSNSSPHQKCRNQSNRNWKHHTADNAANTTFLPLHLILANPYAQMELVSIVPTTHPPVTINEFRKYFPKGSVSKTS